ncbi:MAG TPA: hypothetical protein VEU33_15455 [Archangium sp.]|nr:hypothetical protein [Archangium sp.]
MPGGAIGIVHHGKTTRGDDRLYTYEVPFGTRTYVYTVGLAPDDRLTRFFLRPK